MEILISQYKDPYKPTFRVKKDRGMMLGDWISLN